jgi:thiol-disulfide isomerase/thioredoxin
MDKKTIITFVVAIALILGAVVFFTSNNSATSVGPDLTAFAHCLKAKGATFYGAFWCPHCQAEKKQFGAAVDQLPYVECSTPDANGQTQVCINKGITEYPTWYFADGTSETGVLTLQQLADKTGCVLPAGAAAGDSADDVGGATSVGGAATTSAATATSTS